MAGVSKCSLLIAKKSANTLITNKAPLRFVNELQTFWASPTAASSLLEMMGQMLTFILKS